MQVEKPNRQKLRVFQQNYDFRGQLSIQQKIIREKNQTQKGSFNPEPNCQTNLLNLYLHLNSNNRIRHPAIVKENPSQSLLSRSEFTE